MNRPTPTVIPNHGPLRGAEDATDDDTLYEIPCVMRLFRCDSDEPIVLTLPARHFRTRVTLGERSYRYVGYSPTSARRKRDYTPHFDYSEETSTLNLDEVLTEEQFNAVPAEALEPWRPAP